MYDRGVGPTLTDDMGNRLDFGSLEDWDNPSIERRTNPVAKLFKAVWAWHFLTTIGLVFLILGAVNVVFSKDLEGEGCLQPRGYGFSMVSSWSSWESGVSVGLPRGARAVDALVNGLTNGRRTRSPAISRSSSGSPNTPTRTKIATTIAMGMTIVRRLYYGRFPFLLGDSAIGVSEALVPSGLGAETAAFPPSS